MHRWPTLKRFGLHTAGSLTAALLLVACGGSDGGFTPGDNGGGNEPVPLSGIFIDSPVIGIDYATETQSGKTDENGSFDYFKGETITFSIGDTVFPSTAAKPIITPLDLVGTDDPTNQAVLNISRLLQSLDLDGNVNNGITIPVGAAAASTDLDFTIAKSEFEIASTNFVANAGGVRTTLIDESVALTHLLETLLVPALTETTTLGSGTDLDNVDFLTAVSRRIDGTYIDVSNDTLNLQYDPILNSYEAAINTGTWTLDGSELCTITKNGNRTCVYASVAGNEISRYSDLSKTQLINVETIAERAVTGKLPGRYEDAFCANCFLQLDDDRTATRETDGVIEDFTWRVDADGNLRLTTLDGAVVAGSERIFIKSSQGTNQQYDVLDVIVYTKFDDDFARMYPSTYTRVP